MFVYMLSIIFDTSLSLYMKGYYISTTTLIAPLIKSFKRNMSLLSITTPKSLNHPYAGYLFVFQIFFCAWETKEESQIDVE
jgi:hypothetical protein